jgi:very-short-patch-repair endonuclease
MRGANVIKTGRARRLRRQSTDAEQKLRNRLRSRAINGFKFVRQEPIGPYVVDFICREQRLIIEVDGGQHATDKRDVVRDRWLADNHFRVLRFWNNDVIGNIEGVLETIANALQVERRGGRRGPGGPGRPPPPPGRGGAHKEGQGATPGAQC